MDKAGTPLINNIAQKRAEALYHNEEISKIRSAHDNPDIKNVYSNFLGMPLSKLSKTCCTQLMLITQKKYVFKEN